MPLVRAQCPNCNGNLEVDASQDAAICPFCGTPYIVEKAVNNITNNVSNTYYVENAILGESESVESQIERGLKFIELNEGDSAFNVFRSLAEQHPEDYRGWLGTCIAEYLIDGVISESTKDNVYKTAPTEVQDQLGDFTVYSELEIDRMLGELEAETERIDDLIEEKDTEKYLTSRLVNRRLTRFIVDCIFMGICMGFMVFAVYKRIYSILFLVVPPFIIFFVYAIISLRNRYLLSKSTRVIDLEIERCEEDKNAISDEINQRVEEINGYCEIEYYINILKNSV